MSARKFHLAFFTKFGAPAWRALGGHEDTGDWWTGDYYVELAQRLELACFDALFFEDGAALTRTGPALKADLRNSIYSPQHDPLPLLPVLARETEHIGLIATASVAVHNPYVFAREMSTIDSLSRGRTGWNIVTTGYPGAVGRPPIPDEARYDAAEEFMRVCRSLWTSWQPDALVRDAQAGVYVDPDKVALIDVQGRYFSARGALNTLPSPQRMPVIAQAGGSPAGRDFAARHAEIMVTTTVGGVEAMRAVRDDMRARAASYGRDPDDIKVFYIANIAFADGGMEELASMISDEQVEVMRTAFSFITRIDLSGYALDAPFPVGLEAGGHTSILHSLEELGRQGRSLRYVLLAYNYGLGQLELVGSPAQVADCMAAAMEEIGGDGFFIHGTSVSSEDYLKKLTEGVVPRLRELGVIRTSYTGATFRDVLREF